MKVNRVLVVWKEDSRVWLYPKEIEMQLPKAIKVSSIADALLVVEVYNRTLLFLCGEGTDEKPFEYLRISASGKTENLTDKVHRAYSLVSGSTPLAQGGMFDGDAKSSKSARKSP